MAIIVICHDGDNAQGLRKQHLQSHFRYIEGILDKLAVAGPINQLQAAHYDGSCFIYDTDDVEEAKQLFDNDPYVKAGVYRSYSFSTFMPAAGKWIGGKVWS